MYSYMYRNKLSDSRGPPCKHWLRIKKRKAGRDHGSNWAGEKEHLLIDKSFLITRGLPIMRW